MAKALRGRRTKVEVQQEFDTLAEEVAASKAATSTKETLVSQLNEAEVRAAVSEISIEVIIHKLADLNVEITKSLSQLSEKMAGEVTLLNQIRSANRIEQEQLHKLHQIDIAATSLDQLIEDYEQKKTEFDTEITMTRQSWEKEKKLQEESALEYDKNLKNTRLREGEEYKYERDLARKKEQHQDEEQKRIQEKQNQEKQESLEKSWQLREENLKERELHLQELQQAVDAFPARLKEEIDRARLDASKQTEQRLSQELLLAQKDREAEQRIAEIKIRTFEERATTQQEQISRLQKQLEEAKREVKEIAEKAIEGASGARTLTHVNQIAMEQAKNRSAPS